jgi:signal transduction histidine kinase
MTNQMRRLFRLPLSSLRARLLTLIVVATFPAVLFIFFLAARERSALLERMETDAHHVARLASREHSQQIRGARELLHWLGAKLSTEGSTSSVLADTDFLQALLAGHPQLANIGLLSPDGNVLASAYPLSDSATMAKNPAFLAALDSNAVATGTYVVSPIFKRPTLNHAYAVRDAEQRVVYVLFCGLDLDWLADIVDEVDYAGPFAMLIADKDGRILSYADSAGLENMENDALVLPEIAELSRSRQGKLLNIQGSDIRRYFVASQLQDDPNLYVAVSLPYEQIMRQSNSVFYGTLAMLAMLTLFTATTVYFATEIAVLRTLHALTGTVRRFGAGDLTARVPAPHDYHELASLARTFNDMADSLAERHREAVESEANLRALSTRLQQVQEAEAARISRELHDEIGQLLTSLKFGLSHLSKQCGNNESDRACAERLQSSVEEMNQQIAAAIEFVRRIASDLRPSVLDKLGLAAALEWQANELETRTGLIIDVKAEVLNPPPDELVSVTLFRIAQEALTNVVRHAEAGVAEVRLAGPPNAVLLEIHDDGKGIVAGAQGVGTSLGLTGMRERAMLIGAEFSIESTPEQGTKLRVLAPRTAPWEQTNAHTSRG